uniref:Craniofacial development protein 2-like n=1 Tax=Tanacetum cinerariifolium TaxID=118510 RepID=A0A6L2NQ69_TANCI|nr:hypothetical protein [Tanacetum cinerariifolium]
MLYGRKCRAPICWDQGGLGGYSETRRGRRVEAFRRIRVGSWNETKWKGSSNKEVNGYKLWYTDSHTARNGVGVILRASLMDKVVYVNRCSDRIISLTLVIEGEIVNVISAYAPQVGLREEEKKAFRDSFDEVVQETPTDQRLILGADLNGHILATIQGYSGAHGGFGYGVRNEEGRSILDFTTAHNLAVVNSYFKKRDHHLITFQSGGRCTQIDYLLMRREDLKACKETSKRVRSAAPRILWKNLNGDATDAFRSRVSKGVSTQIEAISASDADSMWNTLASIIKDASKDSFGVATGTSKIHTAHRESWWPCEEVQSKVTKKQARFRELLSCREGNQEERPRAHERIKQSEVKTALQKMRRNKAVGPDQIPIKVWKFLRGEGISWLTSLFNKIFTSAKMPEEWRLSDVIPIFKNKELGEGIATLKRRHHDIHGDGVRDSVMMSGRGRLKVDLEPFTWRRPQEYKATPLQ